MSRRVVFVAVLVALALGAGTSLARGAFTAQRTTPQQFTAVDTFAPPVAATLVAQSRTNDGGASGSQVQLGLKLLNTGDGDVDLGTVSMRYWFTSDGAHDLVPACYYATFGCGQVGLGIVRLDTARQGASHYLEVSFQGGPLAPGAAATLDQLAFRDQSGAVMTQGNDHSFAGQGSFADNGRVTVYVGGALVWGTEPGAQPVTRSGEVRYVNLDTDPHDPGVKPGLQVVNTGTADIDLSTLTVRYWFTADAGTASFQGFCDYAQMGCSRVSTSFGAVSPARPGADHYLEVHFTGTLDNGVSTGPIQLRFHKQDFSPFDETNDHSYGTNTSYAPSTKITAYIDGKLVWGTEP